MVPLPYLRPNSNCPKGKSTSDLALDSMVSANTGTNSNTGTLLNQIKLTCAFYSKEQVQISPQVESQCRARLYQYMLPPQHQQEIHNPVLVLQVGVMFVYSRGCSYVHAYNIKSILVLKTVYGMITRATGNTCCSYIITIVRLS